MTLNTLDDLDVADQTVFVRVDFNTPLSEGAVTDDTRIQRALPTIAVLREQGARLVLASHLGRPRGQAVPALSLLPVAARLAEILDDEVIFAHESSGDGVVQLARELAPGKTLVLENLRFDPRETAGDSGFARALAATATRYVNDAFGTMHREHASITGVPRHLPAAAGRLVQQEIAALEHLIGPDPAGERAPFAAILGGAKVSDKIGVIDALSKRVDHLFIGGAMAYTFLASQNESVGRSRVEDDKVPLAAKLMARCANRGVRVHLPIDHVVAESFDENAAPTTVSTIPPESLGLDIGPETLARWTEVLARCHTIFWNGPLGVFEWDSFAGGTRGVAEALGGMQATTIVGGGDSAAAVVRFGVSDRMTHISTGGGAALTFIESGDLPGLAALRGRV